MGQLPDEPEDVDDAGEIHVTGPDGQPLKLQLPDLGERPQRDRPEYHPGDALLRRRP